jgi:hypothetical protein
VSQQTAVTLTAVALMKTQNESQYCNSRQIITATKTPAAYLCHCLTTAHMIQTVFLISGGLGLVLPMLFLLWLSLFSFLLCKCQEVHMNQCLWGSNPLTSVFDIRLHDIRSQSGVHHPPAELLRAILPLPSRGTDDGVSL